MQEISFRITNIYSLRKPHAHLVTSSIWLDLHEFIIPGYGQALVWLGASFPQCMILKSITCYPVGIRFTHEIYADVYTLIVIDSDINLNANS